MSSRQRRNTAKHEQHSNKDLDIYTLGTMMAGTDRSLEDSISGYTPIMIDRRGNRRFHGAFTGGFSAGHFNTVGSAQGYKAKYETWSSSRNNKNKEGINQTPMDFMDDEDMATNTNLLMTSKPFNSLNNTSMDILNRTKSNITKQFGDTMTNYLIPDKNAVFNHTKGIQLLKKCGWRTGKNIGDKANITRLKLLLKKQDELLLNNRRNELLFGNHILNNNDKQSNDHDQTMVSIYRPNMKTDVHGIGYDADNEEEMIMNERKRVNTMNTDIYQPLKKKRKLLSSRHGLSALEETEVGDDVYGDDYQPQIGYNTFIEHSDDDDVVLINDKHRNDMRHKTYNKDVSKTDGRMRSKDGTLPINGFVVSSVGNHYEYDLKQEIQRSNDSKNRNNYRSEFRGFKEFKSCKMEIDKEFVHKFGNMDLTIGSFLCRNKASNTRKITSFVLRSTSSIPHIVPNAQETKNTSQHLQSVFTQEETICHDVTMSGLRAGLTLSTHIPGKNKAIHKANELLNDIRSIFGNENAEKLLRFDVFLADKLSIESPIDTDNNVLFDDGNKTQFELNKEQFEFNEKWEELQKHKEYLYPNKQRLHKKEINDKNEDIITSKYSKNMTPKQAAECNMYGALTRNIEMWIPDRLLCKRCNVRDPFQGMYDEKKGDKQTEQVMDKGSKSKGEQIAAMMRGNDSNKEPPILQLKQLKTWNIYLKETEHNVNMDNTLNKNKKEMNSFIDGILNDSDSSENINKVDIDKGDVKKQEMTLFKSIFEDNGCTESDDTEEEESDGDAQETDVTATMPKIGIEEDDVNIKESIMSMNEEEENQVIIPRTRKKFKFIAKEERERKNVSARFGSIDVMDKRRNEKNIDMDEVVQQFEIEHESDDCDDTMIWKVIDNDSSESNRESEYDEHRKKRKRKKRKEKRSKKKSKHKKKKRRKSKRYKDKH